MLDAPQAGQGKAVIWPAKGEKKLLPFSVHKFSSTVCKDEYRSHLEKVLQDQPYIVDMSMEKEWNELKTCIVSMAENAIGRGRRKQPEWFEGNAEELLPLITAKNVAHHQLLTDRSVAAKKELR